MKLTVAEVVRSLTIAFISVPFSLATAVAQEYLPPGINIIDPPFDYIRRLDSATRTENHLVVVGLSDGPACQPDHSAFCPTLHIYENQGDSWMLQQTVEFAEAGLAWVKHVDQDKFVLTQRKSFTGSSADFEVVEYELNATSTQWEATIVSRAEPDALAYYNGTYLVVCDGVVCGNISFLDNIDGTWQVTDILYLSDVRLFDDYFVSQVSVSNGFAYVMFCDAANACVDNRGIAVVDLTTRTFVDYFDVQIPGYTAFAIFGDQIIVATDDNGFEPPFQPPQIYEKIAGTWLYVGDAIPSFQWPKASSRIAQTDVTLFEIKRPRIDSELADALIFYQRNTALDWEQIGSVLIPDGDRLMNLLKLSDAYGPAAYFVEGTNQDDMRVLEVTDYFAYLDRDKDIMPQWWEELYGFSPDAFDDFLGDTDQDGLSDTREYALQTSPVNSDTDGDQMPDAWELQQSFDPRDPTDGVEDPDQDGFSNTTEYLNGTDPHVKNQSTTPPPTSSGGGGATSIVWLCLLFVGFFTVRPTNARVSSSGSVRLA